MPRIYFAALVQQGKPHALFRRGEQPSLHHTARLGILRVSTATVKHPWLNAVIA